MRDHQIYDPEVETRSTEAQFDIDRTSYRRQIAYLLGHSEFYQKKLAAAGFDTPEQVGGLDAIAQLPFTEKDELRASQVEFPTLRQAHSYADPDSKLRQGIQHQRHHRCAVLPGPDPATTSTCTRPT